MATNLALHQPAFDDVGPAAATGAMAPILSGEAALVGVGEAAASRLGLAGLDSAASIQTGVFGIVGAAADAGINRSGIFAPGQAAAASAPKLK